MMLVLELMALGDLRTMLRARTLAVSHRSLQG
jgi:hypothetical protein